MVLEPCQELHGLRYVVGVQRVWLVCNSSDSSSARLRICDRRPRRPHLADHAPQLLFDIAQLIRVCMARHLGVITDSAVACSPWVSRGRPRAAPRLVAAHAHHRVMIVWTPKPRRLSSIDIESMRGASSVTTSTAV